jgi:hypothetical protein
MLEELLQNLKLYGEDIEGVLVPKSEVEALKEGTKWMAVMRLFSSKPFSAPSMKKALRFALAPTKEVNFRDLEDNMFIVQAKCLGDWERITKHGP